MEDPDSSPELALEKDPFQLTVEDVYDISYVIGRDLLKIGSESKGQSGRISELQFKIVRVLELLEAMVNQCSLNVEELKMEKDNLKKELERVLSEGARGDAGQLNLGPDKQVIDLTDPNRPRFTLQELREVLQERNRLKAQLLIVQEELQCYKSGSIPPNEEQFVTMENGSTASSTERAAGNNEYTMIKRLFSFKPGKQA
ncbi:RILP-like protein 2 [Microcaecilia unicolor]|uniref:RILP-like protein 2 n=1 Tax=Microcaecilia unicolor TaxID=1415580 RepID=A0A6P7Z2S1_9AMPH|nr:RILP-like protein 2 [Microcaecilia unicolor]